MRPHALHPHAPPGPRSTATAVFLAVLLLPTPPPLGPRRPTPTTPTPPRSAHRIAGTRWMPSPPAIIVHFVCRTHAPYRVGLSTEGNDGPIRGDAQLRRAYFAALREAVADWAERMQCPTLRAELDPPDADTALRFGIIAGLDTLAVATRAGDVTLRSDRPWFPGSKHQGKYLPSGEVSFYWVVAHELGHVFGLGHSARRDALMYPTQCHTCRWSSFEQAGANVIHAASVDPSWSLSDRGSPHFARTPLSAIPTLLSGTLPEEALALLDPAAPENTCQDRPVGAGHQTLWSEWAPPPQSSLHGPFPESLQDARAALEGLPWRWRVRLHLAARGTSELRRAPAPDGLASGHSPWPQRPSRGLLLFLLPGILPQPARIGPPFT